MSKTLHFNRHAKDHAAGAVTTSSPIVSKADPSTKMCTDKTSSPFQTGTVRKTSAMDASKSGGCSRRLKSHKTDSSGHGWRKASKAAPSSSKGLSTKGTGKAASSESTIGWLYEPSVTPTCCMLPARFKLGLGSKELRWAKRTSA